MEYEVKERTEYADDIEDEQRRGRIEDCLVAFVAVERKDEENSPETVDSAAREIEGMIQRLATNRVLLYPYAHLSTELATPRAAKKTIGELKRSLEKKGYEIHASPFGWYKSFVLSCKGHPLAESLREVRVEPINEEEGPHEYFVLTREGEELIPADYEGGSEGFQVMLRKEALGKVFAKAEKPRYLRLCKKFGIRWEEMSDVGHMSFDPKAALMFDLASDYATSVVNSLGVPVMMVKGTNMFDLSEPAIKEHAELYGDRLYSLKTDKKEFVMRYAACHQQFAMLRNWNISYRQLPFGVFEVADSYRLEQSGETMLCFRTRRMNMPDLHVLCKDVGEAGTWFLHIHDRIVKEAKALDQEYELLINLSSRKALEDNRDLIIELLKREEKEGLIHIYPKGKNFYWTVNVEYIILDDMKRGREIATVQIDVGNSERFGITYVSEKGQKVYPIILHTAVLGTIERFLYTVFDTAVKMEANGKVGFLPLWLNPEQVRILPVSDEYLDRVRSLAETLEKEKIRTGIDDSNVSVSKKVREAKKDWVGYVIVFGGREIKSKTLRIYDRQRDEDREMSLEHFIAEVRENTKEKPFRPMYFPREVTKRPIFG